MFLSLSQLLREIEIKVNLCTPGHFTAFLQPPVGSMWQRATKRRSKEMKRLEHTWLNCCGSEQHRGTLRWDVSVQLQSSLTKQSMAWHVQKTKYHTNLFLYYTKWTYMVVESEVPLHCLQRQQVAAVIDTICGTVCQYALFRADSLPSAETRVRLIVWQLEILITTGCYQLVP